MKTVSIFLTCLTFLAAESADISDLYKSNKNFSGALYGDMPNWNSDKDIVVSPFSLQTVLAMAQSGAKGLTAEEIRNVSLINNSEETELAMQVALSSIQANTVNKIYVENGYVTNENYKSLAENIYKSTFENIEFINADVATKTISDWALDHTNKKFSTYFSRSKDMDKLTKDYLINTLWMSKKWSFPFDPTQSKDEQFSSEANTKSIARMMTTGPNPYNYYESEELDAKLLEVPLEEDTSFTIILPNTLAGISKIEKNMDVALTTPDYTSELIQLTLPKSVILTTYLSVSASLRRLGINSMYDMKNADFSTISGVPGELRTYNIAYDSFIQIDETGIQATAGALLNLNVPTSRHFNANRAFLFYIKVNGIITFVGRISIPEYTIHH